MRTPSPENRPGRGRSKRPKASGRSHGPVGSAGDQWVSERVGEITGSTEQKPRRETFRSRAGSFGALRPFGSLAIPEVGTHGFAPRSLDRFAVIEGALRRI